MSTTPNPAAPSPDSTTAAGPRTVAIPLTVYRSGLAVLAVVIAGSIGWAGKVYLDHSAKSRDEELKALIARGLGRPVAELKPLPGGFHGTQIGNEAVVISPDGKALVVGQLREISDKPAAGSSPNAPAGAASRVSTAAAPSSTDDGSSLGLDFTATANPQDAEARAVAAQMLLQSLEGNNDPGAVAIRAKLTQYLANLPKVDAKAYLAKQTEAAGADPLADASASPDSVAEMALEAVPSALPPGATLIEESNGPNKERVLVGGKAVLDQAKGIFSGHNKTGVTLYAFVDALCSSCKAFHAEVQPYIDAGVVTVMNIPVAGIGGEKSLNLGGAFLTMGKIYTDIEQLSPSAINGMNREVLAKNLMAVSKNSDLLSSVAHNRLPTPTLMYAMPGKKDQLKITEGYTSLPKLLVAAGADVNQVAKISGPNADLIPLAKR